MNNYLVTFVTVILFDILWGLIAKRDVVKAFGFKNDMFPLWLVFLCWGYNVFGLWCLYMGI